MTWLALLVFSVLTVPTDSLVAGPHGNTHAQTTRCPWLLCQAPAFVREHGIGRFQEDSSC